LAFKWFFISEIYRSMSSVISEILCRNLGKLTTRSLFLTRVWKNRSLKKQTACLFQRDRRSIADAVAAWKLLEDKLPCLDDEKSTDTEIWGKIWACYHFIAYAGISVASADEGSWLSCTQRDAVCSSARGDLVVRTQNKATTRQPGILCGWSGGLEQSTTGHSFGTYIINVQNMLKTSVLSFLLHWLTVSRIRAANIVRHPSSDCSHVTAPDKLSFYCYWSTWIC